MILFVKLLLAHMLSDFLLQPNSWVDAKEKNKLKAWQLYAHTFIHFIITMLIVWDLSFILWATIIAAIHFVTDGFKVFFQFEKSRRVWFLADQAMHISVIVIVAIWSQNIVISFYPKLNEYYLFLVTFVYALTQPVSAMIRFIISRWTSVTENNDSLENAGNYVGILERLFVFAFVVSGNWDAIGFLLAAKSVFRFGDLKESKDRKLTEYVLIGTLLSFGIAILAGIVFNSLL
jgi:hypothetical protein